MKTRGAIGACVGIVAMLCGIAYAQEAAQRKEATVDKQGPPQPVATQVQQTSQQPTLQAHTDLEALPTATLREEGASDEGTWDSGRGTDNTCATSILIADPTNYTDVMVATMSTGCSDGERTQSCCPHYTCSCIWYRFVVPVGASACRVSTCDLQLGPPPNLPDTVLTLYSGTTCGNLVEIACSDDAGCLTSIYGPTYSGLGAEFEYGPVTPGSTYWIQCCFKRWCAGTDCSAASGQYQLHVQCPWVTCVVEECGSTINNFENELAPGLGGSHINDGCLLPAFGDTTPNPPWWSELLPNESICGTSFKAADGSLVDSDWYRVVLQGAGPYTMNVLVEAEFDVRFAIVQPGNPDPCVGYSEIVSTEQLECTPYTLSAPGLLPGEYWITVEPQASVTVVAAGKQYRLQVTTAGAPVPQGACCYEPTVGSPTCILSTKANCLTLTNGNYWGDGTTCAGLTCWTCPVGGTAAGDDECLNNGTWADTTNYGCPEPAAFTVIADNQTVCGWGGTHIPSAAPSNLRDNDWWRIEIGEPSKIVLDVYSEFPTEVMVWELGCWHVEPCSTYVILGSTYIPPGVATQWSICVFGRDDCFEPETHDQGFAIVVRSQFRGAPREIPCGQRYWLTVDLEECGAGACCYGALGCVEDEPYDTCVLGGGVFGGEGVRCADMCCPCNGTETPEGEPDCGQPTDTTNGGCWHSDPPYYFGSIPASPCNAPATVCGTTISSDGDWYIYNHPGGLLEYCVTNDFVARLLVLYNPNSPGVCADTLQGWELYSTESCEPECMVINAPARQYWIMIRGDEDDLVCGSAMYQASVCSRQVGACCYPSGECAQVEQADCEAEDGVFQGLDTDCDPNPCCEVECTYNEGEPACGNPDDTVNGGCNSTPPVFGTQLSASGASVCGTVAIWETAEGRSRDTDWYTFTYDGTGDLKFCVASEFPALIYLLDGDCNNLLGWGGTLPADCAGGCIWIADSNPDLTAGVKYLFVAADFDAIDLVGCGSEYEATIWKGPSGACCFEGGVCRLLIQDECTAAGGWSFTPGEDCDPNPCCEPPDNCPPGTDENEANCGLPTDTVNGGCNVTPNLFGQELLNVGDTVCGTTALIEDGDMLRRDTDWYELNHAGGDLTLMISVEFIADVFLLAPGTPDPCEDATGWLWVLDNGCDEQELTWEAAPAGTYWALIAPDFDWYLQTCGAKYTAYRPAAGGACCAPDGSCTFTTEAACLFPNQYLGGGTVCDPNPCVPFDYALQAAGGVVTGMYPTWEEYPGGWVNVWWKNEFALFREKIVHTEFVVQGTPPVIAFNYSASTWPDPNNPPLYANDAFVERVIVPTPVVGPNTREALLPFCPRWVSWDVLIEPGSNFTIRGTFTHVCLPPASGWCLGDMNCSGGSPTFEDIKYFAAAIGSEPSWLAYYQLQNGGLNPTCPWLLGDYNTPKNGVEFSDIKPFADSIGQPCIPYVP